MGVANRWSDDPPPKVLAAMASLARQLLTRFAFESERRVRARKVVKDTLTRGGYFVMGLLLAWLWMMLIGRNVTNRCWLPGAVLRWRHRDFNHKAVDIRLSGLYNGSRVIPFNASIEEARRQHTTVGAAKTGPVTRRKQRALLEKTRGSEGLGIEASGSVGEGGAQKIREKQKKPERKTAVTSTQGVDRITGGHRDRTALFKETEAETDPSGHLTAGHQNGAVAGPLQSGTILGPSQRVLEETRGEGKESRTAGLGVTSVVTLGKDGNALEVVTRPHPKTRLKNLVFGIAATAATWSERKEILRLWWDTRRLRGYVWMDTPDLTRNNCTKGSSTARDPHVKASLLWEGHLAAAIRSINGTCGTGKKIDYSWMDAPDPDLPPVVYSANFSQYAYTHPTGLRSAIRVARVAVEMYRVEQDDVLWYVMGDDDTLFSPPNLASVLDKYDPREMVYIGAPSESHLQNVEFSNEMGYGGGGFAISVALAARLSQIQDECLHRYPEVYGSDARVQACLAELGVHMKKERGFHQYDLLGNVAGALEGHPVTPFLSMHHVAVFKPAFPRKSAMAALAQLTRTMKRHPLEFLQQTMCLNQVEKFSISIAWGYSVRWYPDYIRPTELERPQRTFQAWNRGREPFDFDMDTRNTPVTSCRVPSLFYASGATSRWENGKLLLETSYTRTVTWEEQSSAEDGSAKLREKRRKLLGACPGGEVHVPQREVSEVRVLAPPLTDSWVLAPRRQCCQSVEVIDERTVEIRLDTCKEGQTIS